MFKIHFAKNPKESCALSSYAHINCYQVGELRDQLEARGQLNKGLKSQLLARLQKCLKTEQVSLSPIYM